MRLLVSCILTICLLATLVSAIPKKLQSTKASLSVKESTKSRIRRIKNYYNIAENGCKCSASSPSSNLGSSPTLIPPSVFVCELPHWQGACVHQVYPPGYCISKENAVAWIQNISSFGPDYGFYCVAYKNPNCHALAGPRRLFQYPGVANLSSIGWDDDIQSYHCF